MLICLLTIPDHLTYETFTFFITLLCCIHTLHMCWFTILMHWVTIYILSSPGKAINHQMLGCSIEPLTASWPVGCRELHVESSALCLSQLAEHMQRHARPLSVVLGGLDCRCPRLFGRYCRSSSPVWASRLCAIGLSFCVHLENCGRLAGTKK